MDPVRGKGAETESDPGQDGAYLYRCSSHTESYKILQSLLVTFTMIGSMGWKDFSKTGCWMHVTKSTVYAIIMIIWLSANVVRWCFTVNVGNGFGVEFMFKLTFVFWAIETLTHSIGFFVASLSFKRLPEFLFEWDKLRSQNSQNVLTLKKQTDICTAVTWLLACLSTGFCSYLSFGTPMHDYLLYPVAPEDNPHLVLVMNIINVLGQAYLTFAWIAPSALLFMVANFLAWEFNYTTEIIRKRGSKSMTFSLEKVRKHHQNLCNLVDQADDIFSVQIGATFAGSLLMICLLLYVLIHGEDATALVLCIQAYWLTTAVCKILIDCISGARLNTAAHSAYCCLHDLDLLESPLESSLQLTTFLNRLTGPPIGLTAAGMFVVDKPTILTMVGAIVTYFFLLFQVNPSSAESSLSINATNVSMQI